MHRKLGKTTIQVAPIIMGCWQVGKAYWQNIQDEDSIMWAL